MGMSDSPAPAVPSPMDQANAQISLEQAQAKIASDQTAATKAQNDADEAAKVAKAQPLQAQAYQAAQSYAPQQIAAQGLDPSLVDKYGVSGLYNTAIDAQKRGIAADDTNPDSDYSTANTLQNALATAQGTYRNDLTKQYNTTYGDTYDTTAIPDNLDDSVIQAILGSQRTDAQSVIDAAHARGQLNDVGYTSAENRLNAQGNSATSQLQQLGQGILGGYRTQIDNNRNSTLNKIGGATFALPYDINSAMGQLGTLTNSLKGGLSNDLYRAADGQSFFDPSTIVSSSGAFQGLANPSAGASTPTTAEVSPLLSAFQDANKKTGTSLTSASGNGAF